MPATVFARCRSPKGIIGPELFRVQDSPGVAHAPSTRPIAYMRTSYPDPNDAPRGPGCCSDYVIPPLFILIIAGAALALAFRSPGSMPSPTTLASASISPSQLAPLFTPEVQYWGGAITRWAAEGDLDPNLAAVVMQIESCGDPRALSRSGAMGLFQVMPYHFQPSEAPYLPDTNALRGISYLKRALDASAGAPRLAFAGYNGGIGVIDRAEWTWPAETVRYAYWGSGIYEDARLGASSSSRLDEWLAAGGASLCRRAHARLDLPP